MITLIIDRGMAYFSGVRVAYLADQVCQGGWPTYQSRYAGVTPLKTPLNLFISNTLSRKIGGWHTWHTGAKTFFRLDQNDPKIDVKNGLIEYKYIGPRSRYAK